MQRRWCSRRSSLFALTAVAAAAVLAGCGGAAHGRHNVRGDRPVAVARAPLGPAVPAGGWSVAYADGFALPIGSGPGHDNTLYPNRFDNCGYDEGYNPDEMETFACSAVSTTAAGLVLRCTYAPHIASFDGRAANYTCGSVHGVTGAPGASRSGYVSPPGYRFFSFSPGRGQEWAIQIVARFPPNTGEADPGWWATDARWTQEIDFFEGFGAQAGAGGTWCHPTSGDRVGAALPDWIYNTAAGAHLYGGTDICRDLGFDPHLALHTYTTVIYPNATVAEFVDGKPVTWSYVPNGGPAHAGAATVLGPPPQAAATWFGLILSYGLRDNGTGNPDPYFQSGTRRFTIRSIAVYENATAHQANTINAGLAPGTKLR